MVVIYCFLERNNEKVLKFNINFFFNLKQTPPPLKRHPHQLALP